MMNDEWKTILLPFIIHHSSFIVSLLLGLGPHAVVVGAAAHEYVACLFLAVVGANHDDGAACFHVLRIVLRIVLRQTEDYERAGEGADGSAECRPTEGTGEQAAGKYRSRYGDHAGGHRPGD